jgi:tRNA G18 (ribose-2'-O)-methylase SpoU
MHGAAKKDAGGKVAVQSLNVAQAASIAFYEAAQIR